MRVGFQTLAQHAARIAMAGLVLHDEVLREQLQHDTVFAQLHFPRPVERAIYVALLDFTGAPQVNTAAAVGAANHRAAETHRSRFNGDLSFRLGLTQYAQNAFGHRILVCDTALDPSARPALAVAEEAHMFVLQQANHAACTAAAQVETDGCKWFRHHGLAPAVMRSSSRRSNTRTWPECR